jgi:hypothetical protein
MSMRRNALLRTLRHPGAPPLERLCKPEVTGSIPVRSIVDRSPLRPAPSVLTHKFPEPRLVAERFEVGVFGGELAELL